MKKLILFLIILWQFEGGIFAQIIANNSTNKSVTITPTSISQSVNITLNTNTGLGENALINISTVTNNTGIGYQALQIVGSNFPNPFNGNNNTAVGYFTLFQNSQGYDNSAFGFSPMPSSGDSNSGNVAFGKTVLYANTTGSNNSAFGESSLTNNSTGNNNVAFGLFAMTVNQSSNNHVAFGVSALQNHITNDNIVSVGANAFYKDQTGTSNVGMGESALSNNISGNSCTAIGEAALGGGKTEIGNVGLGYVALYANDGQNNTAAGHSTLKQNTTGSSNVAIGLSAFQLNITGSGNVGVGSLAGYNETGSNKLYIDNAIAPFNALTVAIGGDFAANKVCIACNMANTGVNDFITRSEAFQVTGNAFKTSGSGLWIFPSDRRLKTKIVSLNRDEILAKILMMQGVNYELIANPEQGTQYGFIAQDLRKIFPTKVYENKVGYLSSSYGDYVPMFVEALKALNERVEKLEEHKFDAKAMTAKVVEMERKLK